MNLDTKLINSAYICYIHLTNISFKQENRQIGFLEKITFFGIFKNFIRVYSLNFVFLTTLVIFL